MTDDEKEKVRKNAEFNIKMQLYQQPAFPFYQSMGIKEFFYPVQSDNELVGFLHIWWNKDKMSGIVQGGHEAKGFWETTWYDRIEDKPKLEEKGVKINHHKLQLIAQEEERKRHEKIALRLKQEEKLQKLTAPAGILKKYLS